MKILEIQLLVFFEINMKNMCTKFQNNSLNTVKALALWKMLDNPSDNHTDTQVT